jgi:hypothetical protein
MIETCQAHFIRLNTQDAVVNLTGLPTLCSSYLLFKTLFEARICKEATPSGSFYLLLPTYFSPINPVNPINLLPP